MTVKNENFSLGLAVAVLLASISNLLEICKILTFHFEIWHLGLAFFVGVSFYFFSAHERHEKARKDFFLSALLFFIFLSVISAIPLVIYTFKISENYEPILNWQLLFNFGILGASSAFYFSQISDLTDFKKPFRSFLLGLTVFLLLYFLPEGFTYTVSVLIFIGIFVVQKSKENIIFSSVLGLIAVLIFSDFRNFELQLEDKFYPSKVIAKAKNKNSDKFVLTEQNDEVTFWKNNVIRFSTYDEYRFFEALTVPILLFAETPKTVLLVGDEGMALKEILKFDSIEKVVLIGTDSLALEVVNSNPKLKEITKNALQNPKLKISFAEVESYLEKTNEKFDCIFLNLPDPVSEIEAKFYTKEFYSKVAKRLNPDGFGVTQSFSPFFTPRAFWCVKNTLEEVGFFVTPARISLPSFGEWGFQIFSREEFGIEEKKFKLNNDFRYFSEEAFAEIFAFGEDTKLEVEEVNSTENLVLWKFYLDELKQFGQ
ncbi:MAG: hypothetical protein DWQ06_03835 [Calditrichaeota bacterium]|nr:MAG: hypothetical protein DWQ06_03835 [Calditrichota bacterium]